jgi:membrane-associated phospholipid phosphatase
VSARVTDVRTLAGGDPWLAGATVLGLVVVSLCALLITQLVDEVSEGDDAAPVDEQVLAWVIDHRTPSWTTIAQTVTHLADPWVVALLVLLTALALLAVRRRRLAVFVVVSSAGAAAVSSVAKQAMDRTRPPTESWLGEAWGPAFPSGHATQSVALYGALAIVACVLVRSPGWRAVFVSSAVAVAAMVGATRVYLGVHWMSDVLCGWAIGTLWLTTLVLVGWARPRLRSAWADHRMSTAVPPG